MNGRPHLCLIAGLAAGAALMVAGCAPRTDMENLQNNEFSLRGMVASDRQNIEALDQRMSKLEDQIQELQHAQSADAGEPHSGSNRKLAERVSKLESTVTAMQAGGAAGVAAAAVPPVASDTPPPASSITSDSGGSDVGSAPPSSDTALADTGDTGAAGAEAMPPPPLPVAVPKWSDQVPEAMQVAAKTPGPAGKLYRSGLESMREGKYQAAIASFSVLQKKYPHSEVTEPAEYFSANAYFEKGEYDRAILQFNDLVMRFPKGRYATVSLLREAQAFVKLKDKIDARLTLQKLINDHGDSPEASIASSMMKDLERD